MVATRDPRDGHTWRWRTRVKLPDGTIRRISGTAPAADPTQSGARAAEAAAVTALLAEFAAPALPSAPALPAPRAPQRPAIVAAPTLATFARQFLASYGPDQKPSHRYGNRRIVLGHLVPAFGHLRLDGIAQHHVDAWVERELARCARQTVRTRLVCLSTLLRYAVECRVLAERPALRLSLRKRTAAASVDIPAVPPAHVARLLAVATPVERVAVLLAAEAGLRCGELIALQWPDVAGELVNVERARDQRNNLGLPKHDRTRAVPMSAAIREALPWAPRRAPWVLTRDNGSAWTYHYARRTIARLYARAGVPVPRSKAGVCMPLHSLRHTFGTTLALAGVDVQRIARLMGHEDVRVTSRYMNPTGDDLAAAIARTFGAPEKRRTSKLANKPRSAGQLAA